MWTWYHRNRLAVIDGHRHRHRASSTHRWPSHHQSIAGLRRSTLLLTAQKRYVCLTSAKNTIKYTEKIVHHTNLLAIWSLMSRPAWYMRCFDGLAFRSNMAKYCQPCPGFKKSTVGDVLLDLVPSTGDICLLHNYLLTTDFGLSSCYMSRQLNEDSMLLCRRQAYWRRRKLTGLSRDLECRALIGQAKPNEYVTG